jgi:1,4-dihydroxy-2-naphthoate octaprenyltransferase
VTAFVGFAFNGTTALALSPLIFSTFYVRYYLKRHTFGELISGVILGFIVVLAAAGLGLVR